jgi:hypothetical protein
MAVVEAEGGWMGFIPNILPGRHLVVFTLLKRVTVETWEEIFQLEGTDQHRCGNAGQTMRGTGLERHRPIAKLKVSIFEQGLKGKKKSEVGQSAAQMVVCYGCPPKRAEHASGVGLLLALSIGPRSVYQKRERHTHGPDAEG